MAMLIHTSISYAHSADVSMTYLCRQLTKSVPLLLNTIVVTLRDTVPISMVPALIAKPNTKCIL